MLFRSHDLIWPGVFVSYASLPRVVTEVRHAVGRARRPRFVRTVREFGYAFTGQEVQEAPAAVVGAPSPCSLRWGKRKIRLAEGETLIGRRQDCGVRIDSTLASRHHAVIRVSAATATLEDCQARTAPTSAARESTDRYASKTATPSRWGRRVLVFIGGGREPFDSTATEEIDV